MTTDQAVTSGLAAKALAFLCLAGFWALPFSPLVAIGAVKMTQGGSGWARRAAVSGAVLCSAYTLAMAILITRLYILIPS